MSGRLEFERMWCPFPQDKVWGAQFAERWSFCIAWTEGLGFTATWKDHHDETPRQAVRIGDVFRSMGAARKACEQQARSLLS